MVNRVGCTVLRTSLAVALIATALVAAVMEVQAGPSSHEARGAEPRRRSDTLWIANVAEHCFRVADELAAARRRS